MCARACCNPTWLCGNTDTAANSNAQNRRFCAVWWLTAVSNVINLFLLFVSILFQCKILRTTLNLLSVCLSACLLRWHFRLFVSRMLLITTIKLTHTLALTRLLISVPSTTSRPPLTSQAVRTIKVVGWIHHPAGSRRNDPPWDGIRRTAIRFWRECADRYATHGPYINKKISSSSLFSH